MIAHWVSVSVVRIKLASPLATLNHSPADLGILKRQQTLVCGNQLHGLIPDLSDQNPCAQSRMPIEVILAGWAKSLFQAMQQWATMSS